MDGSDLTSMKTVAICDNVFQLQTRWGSLLLNAKGSLVFYIKECSLQCLCCFAKECFTFFGVCGDALFLRALQLNLCFQSIGIEVHRHKLYYS